MPTQRKRATKKVTRAKKSADSKIVHSHVPHGAIVIEDLAPNPAIPGLWDPQNGNMLDTSYHNFLHALQQRVTVNIGHHGPHIFTTDTDPKRLWEDYRSSFPTKAERQHHNCSECRHFIQRFGGLVVINEEGLLRPLLWDQADAAFNYPKLSFAISRMYLRVVRSAVTGVWVPDRQRLPSTHVLGTPATPPWRHMSFELPVLASFDVPKATQTADQFMAERREDFKNVTAAAQEFRRATLELAHQWLSMPASPFEQSEQYVKPLEFLMEFQKIRSTSGAFTRDDWPNQAWRLLAAAPAGFCHPKSGMLGMLLTWIQEKGAGYGYGRDPIMADAIEAWNIARDPTRYMRPTAAPKAGTIVNAEKIVAQLGLEKALQRRIAFHNDLPSEAFLWSHSRAAPRPESQGVFGHLQRRDITKTALPDLRYTWAKFEREILPEAASIKFVPGSGAQNYIFLTAPVHADAAKLFKWDNELAWYLYNNGTTARQVGLGHGVGVTVPSVIARPDQFSGLDRVARDCAILLLSGAVETRKPGLALFPQCLRGELHEVRSVLEAHSQRLKLQFPQSAWSQAIGVLLADKQMPGPINLRVTDWNGSQRNVIIDRWD